MKHLCSVVAVAVAAAFGASAANAQIFDLSKYPDWAGQWRRVPDGGPPRYDPSKKAIEVLIGFVCARPCPT